MKRASVVTHLMCFFCFCINIKNASAWNIIAYYYDDNGRHIKSDFDNGTTEVYKYDENGYRIGFDLYDKNGNFKKFYSNTEIKNEKGQTTALYSNGYYIVYDYDTNGNLTSLHNYLGNTADPSKLEWYEEYEYGTDGKKLLRTRYTGDGVKMSEGTYKHDKYGNVIGLYDTNGNLLASSSWSDGWKKKQMKRIYTIQEATQASGKKNSVMIRYK